METPLAFKKTWFSKTHTCKTFPPEKKKLNGTRLKKKKENWKKIIWGWGEKQKKK